MSLSERSKQVRRDAITLSKANGGYHYGGSFSCAEILIHLFDSITGLDDRIILSKGHGCWCYYVLLREKGFDPILEGHPRRGGGVHCTTGSMGHGLPTGAGMALAKRMKREPGRVFVVMGDGECQEGTTWEAILLASRLALGNLVAIVDVNGIQGSGYVRDILPVIGPLQSAAMAAGWRVAHIDGHNAEIVDALNPGIPQGPPVLILAHTVKGNGVSFMEGDPKWHAQWMNSEREAQALAELT